MVGFSIKATITLVKHLDRGDVVLCVTAPPLLPYLGAFAARLRGASFVLLIHDVYPDVLARAGKLDPSSLLYRGFDRANQWLYSRASRIIVLGRDMRDLVAGKLPGIQEKIVIIENWAELEDITPKSRENGARFVFQHAGNAGRTHDLRILLDAAAELTEEIVLELVGGESRSSAGAVMNASQSNVIRRPFSPRELRSESLGECDASVITFLPGMGGVSVPSRMYNVMASGRPIVAVCDADSELALTIREHGIGWVSPPGDLPSLVKVLRAVAANPDEARVKGSRARKVAEARYRKESSLRRFESVLDAVISE
jgi:glycosyltransferase involved in cell wall biosynthesis